MDGVIADFEAGFLEHWRRLHPDKLYVPLEERNTFFILDQYPVEYKDLIWEIFLMPGFFRNLPVIPGSQAALAEMSAAGIEVFICSTPFTAYHNCVLEKYEWVDEHFSREWTKRIVLTHDKTIVEADYLVDDMDTIKGGNAPRWEHILFDLPKNRRVQSKRRLTWANWKEVLLPADG
jgi:5'-nucleotidase